MAITLIRIPAGTLASQCTGTGCNATVYFAPHPKTGEPKPVSVGEEYAAAHGLHVGAPHSGIDGQGFSHFLDCPKAAQFYRKAKA